MTKMLANQSCKYSTIAHEKIEAVSHAEPRRVVRSCSCSDEECCPPPIGNAPSSPPLPSLFTWPTAAIPTRCGRNHPVAVQVSCSSARFPTPVDSSCGGRLWGLRHGRGGAHPRRDPVRLLPACRRHPLRRPPALRVLFWLEEASRRLEKARRARFSARVLLIIALVLSHSSMCFQRATFRTCSQPTRHVFSASRSSSC